MTTIERHGSDFVVPVNLLAEAFSLNTSSVREAMRANAITSQSETGAGEDAGRWRLTFFFQDRAYRFVVDANGQVLKRVGFPVRRRSEYLSRTRRVNPCE